MTPMFGFQGGKGRIADWLVMHFPRRHGRYIELFAGRGNVFFAAAQDLLYKRYELYDLDASFLKTLQRVDLEELPTHVNKADFDFWASDDSDIAKIIEPAVSFCGKGYRYGYNNERYKYQSYRKKCDRAQQLLQCVTIESKHWESFDFNSLTEDDFCYLDPPYYETEGPYPNIDHVKLCDRLSNCSGLWALSGYDNAIYSKYLKFKRRFETQRNAEIKGRANGIGESVTEVLWTNY